MNEPKIVTAIPLRFYQFGEFSAKVLGDIESGDDNDYRYIFALVREGQDEPSLYVVSLPSAEEAGSYEMRLISPSREMKVSVAPNWSDLDDFIEGCTQVVQQVMGLKDEVPVRLS